MENIFWKAIRSVMESIFQKIYLPFRNGNSKCLFFFKKKLLSGKVYLEPISIVTKERFHKCIL